MAYQNVGTPRFYVSILQWLKSLGKISFNLSNWSYDKDPLELIDINPSNIITFENLDGLNGDNDIFLRYYLSGYNFKDIMPDKKNFFMVLGHNFNKDNVQEYRVIEYTPQYNWVAEGGYVNYSAMQSQYEGFSIGLGNNAHNIDENKIVLLFQTYNPNVVFKLGSFLYGTYYDMPHSPDLKLTMTREMDGVKRIRTRGGNDLVKHQYTKPAMWGNLGAWELLTSWTNHKLSRSGRRTWDLSFSYLQDSDVFGSNQGLGTWEYGSQDPAIYGNYITPTAGGDIDLNHTITMPDGVVVSNTFAYNLLTDNNFYSQVIHKTNGGQLPFIFQPDKKDNTNFAICKFDMKSFKFEQVANGVYNVKLKIREVW